MIKKKKSKSIPKYVYHKIRTFFKKFELYDKYNFSERENDISEIINYINRKLLSCFHLEKNIYIC